MIVNIHYWYGCEQSNYFSHFLEKYFNTFSYLVLAYEWTTAKLPRILAEIHCEDVLLPLWPCPVSLIGQWKMAVLYSMSKTLNYHFAIFLAAGVKKVGNGVGRRCVSKT